MLSMSFSDDGFMSRQGIESGCTRSMLMLGPEMRHIAPADIGERRIGHFGYFRPKFQTKLWPQIPAWLTRDETQHRHSDGRRRRVSSSTGSNAPRTTDMTIKTYTLNGVATLEIALPREEERADHGHVPGPGRRVCKAADADAAVVPCSSPASPAFSPRAMSRRLLRWPSAERGGPVFQFQRALLDLAASPSSRPTGGAVGIGTTMLLHCDCPCGR